MIPALFLMLALQVTPELREHVAAGLKAKAAGDLDTAAREFAKAVALAPELAAAHVNLGAVYFEQKHYARAIPSLERALELNRDLPGAEGMLGASLLATGYAAKSIAHLERAQADDLLGVGLLEAGRAREAMDRLEAALAKRPGDPDLLYYLSQAHARLSKQAFDRLRESAPDSARAQQMLGEATLAAGDRAEARKHFESALAARADLRGVHYSLGELFLSAGDYEPAEAEFRAEARLAPGSAAAAYKLGVVLLNRGRVNDAIEQLGRSNTLESGMPETLLALGKALNVAGDASRAVGVLLEVIRLEPGGDLGRAAHFQLSQAYRKLGKSAEAERELKAVRSGQLRGNH